MPLSEQREAIPPRLLHPFEIVCWQSILGFRRKKWLKRTLSTGSLIKAMESLRSGDRTLMPLKDEVDETIEQLLPESELLDPEKPIEPEEFLDYLILPENQRPAYRHFLKIIITIVVVLALAALWRWTPLSKLSQY